jgi:hypothetical protein
VPAKSATRERGRTGIAAVGVALPAPPAGLRAGVAGALFPPPLPPPARSVCIVSVTEKAVSPATVVSGKAPLSGAVGESACV